MVTDSQTIRDKIPSCEEPPLNFRFRRDKLTKCLLIFLRLGFRFPLRGWFTVSILARWNQKERERKRARIRSGFAIRESMSRGDELSPIQRWLSSLGTWQRVQKSELAVLSLKPRPQCGQFLVLWRASFAIGAIRGHKTRQEATVCDRINRLELILYA